MGSGNFPREGIDEWLRRQFYGSDEHPDGRCNRLVLSHIAVTGKAGDVHTMPFKKCPAEGEISDIVHEIETHALNEVETMGGVQKFIVRSYFSKSEKPVSRFPFRMSATDAGNEDETVDSEPPSAKGMLSQLMRHNEALARMLTMGTTQIIVTLQKQNANLAAQLEMNMSKELEFVRTTEELLSQKHVRELEAIQAQNKEKRMQELYDKGMLLLPAVANRIAGKQVMNQTVSPSEVMLNELVSTLKPEQFEKLLAVLAPEQRIVLLELYQNMKKAEEHRNGKTSIE